MQSFLFFSYPCLSVSPTLWLSNPSRRLLRAPESLASPKTDTGICPNRHRHLAEERLSSGMAPAFLWKRLPNVNNK
ncbi:hypothetical protein M113_0736 [Bacteroides fragilis str. 3986 N3]|nr:hypothetical protein M112_0744 [Bacteroides fragilis str. 3986 T(B)13]EYE70141.1 hypothetical protein M113_0736 [Bacteroides fragilis str. 3986 N3]